MNLQKTFLERDRIGSNVCLGAIETDMQTGASSNKFQEGINPKCDLTCPKAALKARKGGPTLLEMQELRPG